MQIVQRKEDCKEFNNDSVDGIQKQQQHRFEFDEWEDEKCHILRWVVLQF